MAYADDFLHGFELPDGDFDPEQPFKDISEYCRLQRVQPELQPANKIKKISEYQRNGRMKNFLMSMDKCQEAAELLQQAKRRKDKDAMCKGLSAFLESTYFAQGWSQLDLGLTQLVNDALKELDKQTMMMTGAVEPTGRPMQGFKGTPAEYLLKGSAHPVLAYMMLNKMPGMLPEVIKDCHKVLDRVEGIDMDSPQVAQMVQAIREAPELTTQLPMGVQGMLGLMLTGCRVDLDQLRWVLLHTCCMAAKQDNKQPEFERHAKLMVREAPTNPMAHLMLGESCLMAGDTRSAYSSFKDCLRLSQQQGDDIAGVLAAWQAAQVLLCGATGKTFSEAEIKGLISQAGEFKDSLRVWGGLGMCGPRITLVGKMVRELLREAKKGGYVDTGDRLKVPQHMLARAGVEPALAQLKPRRKCDGCSNEFDQLQRCKQCKQAMYCSRECQLKHWKKHKKVCAQMAQEAQA